MYDSISAAIQTRNAPILYEDLHIKLLNKEVIEHKEPQKETSTTSVMAQRSSPSIFTPHNHK